MQKTAPTQWLIIISNSRSRGSNALQPVLAPYTCTQTHNMHIACTGTLHIYRDTQHAHSLHWAATMYTDTQHTHIIKIKNKSL